MKRDKHATPVAKRVAAHKQRMLDSGYTRVTLFLKNTTITQLDKAKPGKGRSEQIDEAVELMSRMRN